MCNKLLYDGVFKFVRRIPHEETASVSVIALWHTGERRGRELHFI